MKTTKYTQNVHAYLNFFATILFVTGWLILLASPEPTAAQTNDPKLNQQYYIFDHNIDDAWNVTKGSSGTRIAIHSLTGFTTIHEDITGRFLNPSTEWFAPDQGFASEVAGIIGANSNNGVGMAGIDWYGTMKSYNVLRKKQPGDDNPDATFTYDNEDYYLDVGKLDVMVDEAIQDNMDIQLFTFGVPSGKTADLKRFEGENLSGVLELMTTPVEISQPDPRKPFWDLVGNMAQNLGDDLWDTITGNNYTPPSDLELFRQKLWEFSQPANNGVTLAPSGDVYSQELLEVLMPAVFDNYVVTVSGAEKSGGGYIQWPNSQAAPYVDVTAAAKDIVSLQGTGSSAYSSSFSSTSAAAGITSGVASLLKAEEPSLTHDDIEGVLKRTAIDLEGPGEDDKTGAGFVDAQAALNFVNNNDVVHKRSEYADFTIISNNQVLPNPVEMSSAYLSFSENPAQVAEGRLFKLRGKIEFDYLFQQPPEVWLRMTSSGIDTKITNQVQYYDAYDKAFNVTNIEEYEFTFELYYWKVRYYSNGAEVWNENFPDVYNHEVHLDWTAVGQETSTPPPPPPAAPSNVHITNAGASGPGSFPQIAWDDNTEPYFDHYKLYRQKKRVSDGYLYNPVLLSTSSNSSYTDSWIIMSDGNPYDYRYYIYAVNNIDRTSGQSNSTQWVNASSPMKRLSNEKSVKNIPKDFGITHNYPNPFNPSTTVKFGLPEQAEVSLEVYNILGRRVATLVNETKTAGFYTVKFDGKGLSSGLYIARLSAVGESGESFVRELKMQMVK